MAMSQAYDEDVLEWSEHQAQLLRQHAAGLRGNETPDWENIIEEIESVGRSQLSAVRSLLVQALVHDLKCQAWPASREVPHWRAEARGFRDDAAEAFTPSMRQKINMDELYRRALSRLPESIDDQAPLPVPEACPVSLDDMLGAPA
jgi:hypothetical protein